MTTEVSADMVIRFKLFGRMITIPFQDLGVAKIDLYASLGGMYFILSSGTCYSFRELSDFVI